MRSLASRLTDHPRACGANRPCHDKYSAYTGSSPRMRGKLRLFVAAPDWRRIIPAHAGQTRDRAYGRAARTDHPRACGANPAPLAWRGRYLGSSPRMRGKPSRNSMTTTSRRIIPAHAGQTGPDRLRYLSGPDHPRACGANTPRSAWSISRVGSSPRMRGKHWKDYHKGFTVRIIPAHAGQTFYLFSLTLATTDHPRACGANYAVFFSSYGCVGSSPRMRGKHTST